MKQVIILSLYLHAELVFNIISQITHNNYHYIITYISLYYYDLLYLYSRHAIP